MGLMDAAIGVSGGGSHKQKKPGLESRRIWLAKVFNFLSAANMVSRQEAHGMLEAASEERIDPCVFGYAAKCFGINAGKLQEAYWAEEGMRGLSVNALKLHPGHADEAKLAEVGLWLLCKGRGNWTLAGESSSLTDVAHEVLSQDGREHVPLLAVIPVQIDGLLLLVS